MFTPTPSRPGRSRRRRWFSGAVTLLAALAAVVSLSGLQAPGASAGVARVASAGHPAVAAHSPAGHAAAAPKSHANKLKPVIRNAVRHDTSPKLRNIKPSRKQKNHKIRVLPVRTPPQATGGSQARTADVQRSKIVTANNMPSFGQNFEGMSNPDPVNGPFPPDTNMAVGPNDIVQTVNISLAVYDKQGHTLLGPEDLSTLWQGLGGACDPTVDPAAADGGDPVVLYDEQAGRFIVTQLSYPQLVTGTGGYHECIAVSQTGDPTGAWYRYDFLFSNDTLNDYPKFGVWPDAYYESSNDFAGGGSSFSGVTVTAYDRAAMLAGQQASMVQFTTGTQYGNLLPSSTEGSAVGQTPPAGAPNPYFMSCDAANGGPCSNSQMDEWDFHVDWTNPASSTFGNNGDPSTTLPVAEFNSNLCNYDGNCITQPDTSQGLDALSDRLMYQSAYRNLGNGTQAVVMNQTVNVSTNGGNQAGVRWYEFTNTGSGWTVADQGTYAPDSDNRWMGSANIDASGDIAVGYSVSSATTYPSIRVAGRLAGDPAGQLSQGEETLIAGTGSQTGSDNFGRGRWGDYSAMQVDPTDGCTFWYTDEYVAFTNERGWQTRIGSFKFPSCITGPHGTLTGTVTDASTGKPVAGATVSAAPGGTATTTDSQGHYSMLLRVGSYDVSYSAFGYSTKTVPGVQVSDGGTTTQDVALTPTPTVHVTGTVTDGSGHGWPLHAGIDITGDPNGPVWTNPATGRYSVDLPVNATYALRVSTDLPGYQVVNDSLMVGASNVSHDISVPVDPACTAPGYQLNNGAPVLSESFDGSTIPAGWTVADNDGSGQVWQINDPAHHPNDTGGSGNFADINSEFYGPGNTQDTSLITPTMDLSNVADPIIRFHNDYVGYPTQTGAVDVSTDGGQTWTNLWLHRSDSVPGPDLETVHAPQAAGKSSVQFRFHFIATWGFRWELDDVTVQNQSCDPVPGGLVVGKVTDANTSNRLDGATVTSTDNPSDKATTATSGDPGIGDGYYWMFSSLTGSHQFAAAKAPYQSAGQTVNVAANGSTEADFALGAGQLSVSPGSLSTSQVLGTTRSSTMTIKNTGTAPANVKLDERGGLFQILHQQGARLRTIHLAAPASPGNLAGQKFSGNPVMDAGPPAAPAWSSIASYPAAVADNGADFLNGKEYSVGGYDGKSVLSSGYVYDPGQNTWTQIADMPVPRQKPVVAAFAGKLYVTGGWDAYGTPIAETDVYDPSSNSWSTVAPNPSPTATAGVAVANGKIYVVGGCGNAFCTTSTNNVEVYDPGSDYWSSAAHYPTAVSWEGCGAISGKVYCAGGVNNGGTLRSANVYDPSSDSWSPIANLPIDLWGMVAGAPNGMFVVSTGATGGGFIVTNQGFAYDPTTDSWTAIPNAQFPEYRGGGSCGFYEIGGYNPSGLTSNSELLSGLTQCGTADIPWMSESPATATLQPGQSISVTATLSATTVGKVTQPGTYTAQIGFEQDTPYPVNPENVTMNVTPPKGWGRVTGTVSGQDCSGTTGPLRAVVSAAGKNGFQFTRPTDKSGNYAFWGPAGDNPYTPIATADGWIAQTRTIRIKAGQTTTVNFTLRPATC